MKSSSATLLNARNLRKTQTYPEKLLWARLRDRKFKGLKFRRQFPIGIYVVDFYCPEKNLIIEVDGKVHENGDQMIWDKDREENLKAVKYKIVRFKAKDIIKGIDSVLSNLSDYIDKIVILKK